MYQLDRPIERKRRRRWPWLVLALLLIGLGAAGLWAKHHFQPHTTITESKAVTRRAAYAGAKTKHYIEADFLIDLPADWTPKPRPPGTYQSFTWQSSDTGAGGQVIEIFEDTIPVNYAVNRVLIITPETDHVALKGNISDNCDSFTKKTAPTSGQSGVRAKWQGVDFLCDQTNVQRDAIGTSSTDGINTVVLRNQSNGTNHKFFFTYTDYAINPDYTVFYNALNSFKMQ